MIEYSVNNRTFYRCKSQSLKWLGLRYGYKTLVDIESPDKTDTKHKDSIKKKDTTND